ncbi:MAG: PH domain-containing protein [Candidatus Altiarchaeota archaeon]|nr:PH domain-containing protein [Candidatus Altiarchaeota archaeon]
MAKHDFRPSPKLRVLYNIYFAGIILVFYLFTIPLLLLFPSLVLAYLLVTFLGFAYIRAYFQTILYNIGGKEVSWSRGVFFKRTSVVPYTRITNIDAVQGPVQRWLGLGTLKLQTAGYSGQNVRAELRIEGVEELDKLRTTIAKRVK